MADLWDLKTSQTTNQVPGGGKAWSQVTPAELAERQQQSAATASAVAPPWYEQLFNAAMIGKPEQGGAMPIQPGIPFTNLGFSKPLPSLPAPAWLSSVLGQAQNALSTGMPGRWAGPAAAVVPTSPLSATLANAPGAPAVESAVSAVKAVPGAIAAAPPAIWSAIQQYGPAAARLALRLAGKGLEWGTIAEILKYLK
jgi:hypothetical protein